jgi:predicted permease
LLFRAGALRASEAELGDVMEEYAGGNRSGLWLTRQILSTFWRPRSHVAMQEGRAGMLSNLWSDVRYAMRTLRRNPGFAAAAIVPIALGIGINTGVFSILNSVALRPLPTPQSTELVSVYQEFRSVQKRRVYGARTMFSMPEYRAYRDGTKTLSGVMAYSLPRTFTLGGSESRLGPPSRPSQVSRFGEAGSPQEIEGVLVTCNYFDVLRLQPLIGTGFTPATCGAANAPPVVILSHALWTRTFAADPDIVRKTITLNGRSVGVIGVAPEGFDGTDMAKAAFFAPTTLEQGFHEDPNTSWLTMIGRRNQGAGLAQVRAELAVVAGQIDRQQPGRTTTLSVAPATFMSLPVARRGFLSIGAVVLAAFGLLLLIACANVANVLLARAAGRTKEIAVRLSVGASRGRLVQQLLTESIIIAVAGGVAGSLLAWWSFQWVLTRLLSSVPDMIPSRFDAHPNLTVLWFAIGLTVMTALLFGMVPALQASKQDVNAVLKQDGAAAGGRSGGWLRGALISAQVAICMVLLIAAGLLLRALYVAQTADPGFDYHNVAVVSFSLRGPEYDNARIVAFHQQAIERLGALPGVDAVAQVSKIPLSPGSNQTTFRMPHQEEEHVVDINTVSPEYFSLIGIPIVRGRTFTEAERRDPSRTVIVTEATARRYWPQQDPIGRTLLMRGNREEVLEIVGVAKDAHVSHIAETESSYVYLPAGPRAQRQLRLLVRSRGDFDALASSIGALTRTLDSAVVVRTTRLEENLEYWRAGSRLIAGLSGSLGLLALVLASVGVYGVVSYVVSRRRREVGIRMTLGATPRDVRGLILRQTLRPVLLGVAIGIAGASAASRTLQSVLFGVSPFDPIAFVGASLFLLGVAAAASLLPTRAALKVDPMKSLRYE